MKRPLLWAMVSAVVIAVIVIVAAISLRQDKSNDATEDLNSSISIASSFPVPAGATPAFPDSVVNDVATKGWRATGSLSEACNAWRNGYRNWIDQAEAGSITGEDEDGRRCTLSGPKSGHQADLTLTVYGTDTTPQVTLTVRPIAH